MLALTRKTGEFIRIIVPPSTEPQTIALGLLHCSYGSAKLGFTAPRSIEIVRTELTPRSELAPMDPPPVAEAATAI